ncbi:OmpA/MotB family protein [Rhodovibrionaceae bacterium A322]
MSKPPQKDAVRTPATPLTNQSFKAEIEGSVATKTNPQAWMVTFTDLVALMLTFFVLLFSMMKVEEQVWQQLTRSLSDQLNALSVFDKRSTQFKMDLMPTAVQPGIDLDYLSSLLQGQLSKNKALAEAELRQESDRVIISLPGNLLFAPGAFAPNPEAAEAVYALGGLIANFNNRVEVTGHADPTPVGGDLPSNWELSLIRASVVAEVLRRSGYEDQIIVRGYGESRYSELSDTMGQARKLALARRTDIVIHETASNPTSN